MGKGDIKTKRGKRTNGSFGVHRKKKQTPKTPAVKSADKK
ncbi:30S ribosomal protein THX [Hymenobacter sp. HSC-4F20]|nr:30S ribosomal protein THX [Hymenobacter sp. HSC-4F20]MBX0292858.1 30S ribosomal protein THX [Hymenobacter sp. HSC-4F20]